MIIELTIIVPGIILAMGILASIPAVGESLEKVAKWLGRSQTIIGVTAIIFGILYFGCKDSWQSQHIGDGRSNKHTCDREGLGESC